MATYDLGAFGPLPNMNRARYRHAAAMARPGRRIAQERLAGCATGNCGSALPTHVTVGGAQFPVPASLNRPFARGGDGLRRYRPLASMVGQTLSVPALAAVGEDDPDSAVMLRATNLSSVVAVILMNMEPEQRLATLAVMSGSTETAKPWAESVMALAKKIPGGLGIVDAIRFSLAMHYLIGISHDAMEKSSMYATAYRQAVKVYRDAEERVKSGAQVQGLGTTRLAAAAPAKRPPPPPPGMKQCEWWDAGCNAQNLGLAIAAGAQQVAKGVQDAGKNVQEGLNKAADWAGEILCKGLKAIIPEPVGGFLCTVITKGIELLVSFINSMVEVIVQLVDGLVEFVKAVVKLDFMGAAKALLNGVTRIIFILPPIGPLFATFIGVPLNEVDKQRRVKRGDKNVPKSLVELGDEVAKRSPFFILMLVMAIIAVVTGPGRNSIGALIVALAPAVAVITAALLQMGKQFLEMTAVALATAVEKIVKITVVVIQGVMTLVEMFKTFWAKVQSYFERKGGAGAGASEMAGNLMKKFSAKWEKFWNSLTGPFQGKAGAEKDPNNPKKTCNVQDINAALMELVKVGPELLYAIAGDDEELKSAIDDGKAMFDVTGDITKEAKAIWAQKDASGQPIPPAGSGAMPFETVSIPQNSPEHMRLMASIIAAGPVTEQAVAKRYYLAKVGQQLALKQGAAASAVRSSRA